LSAKKANRGVAAAQSPAIVGVPLRQQFALY